MSYLLAVHTLHGKLLLIAGHTEVAVVLRDEALGANRLLTSLAGETCLVPAVPLMLHLPGAFADIQHEGSIQEEFKELNVGFSVKKECTFKYIFGLVCENNRLVRLPTQCK